MGHNRLGVLPKTRRWKEVIELLETGGDLAEIASQSLNAAVTGLAKVPYDPGFHTVLSNIFLFAEAARSGSIVEGLQLRGFAVANDASLFDLVGSLQSKNDYDLSILQVKSDASELAQNAFYETLLTSTDQPALFADSGPESQESLATEFRGDKFSRVMHEFYANFTKRYLSYYVSRELPRHVGVGKYFADVDSHRDFAEAFDLYVRQTVRIVDEFTPGWFAKASREGRVKPGEVVKYAHVAIKKLISELGRENEANG